MESIFIRELMTYVRAGQSFLYVNSREEGRVVQSVQRAGWLLMKPGARWPAKDDDKGREAAARLAEALNLAGEDPKQYEATQVLDARQLLRALDKLEGTRSDLASVAGKMDAAAALIRSVLDQRGYQTACWDIVGSWDGQNKQGGDASLVAAMEDVADRTRFSPRMLFVVKDCHLHLNSASVPSYRRAVRNLFETNELVKDKYTRHVIFLQPYWKPHEDVRHCFVRLDFPLPDDEAIGLAVADAQASLLDASKSQCDPELKVELVQSLRGLDTTNISTILSYCAAKYKGFAPEVPDEATGKKIRLASVVRGHRSRQLSTGQGLRILDPDDPELTMLGNLGGYENVRDLAERLIFCRSSKAQAFKLKTPSGFAVAGPPGTGKAQPLTSKVLTPKGWRTMGQLTAGDEVIGSRGEPVKVLGVFPQGKKRLFRVTFSDGAVVECCDEHLWLTETRNGRRDRLKGRNASSWKVRTTRQIMETITSADGQFNHYVPLVSPVRLDEDNDGAGGAYLLPPYLVGALLGNGGFTQTPARFSSTYAELVETIRPLLKDAGVDMNHLSKGDYSLVHDGQFANNYLHDWLRESGLLGKSSVEKWIPGEYLLDEEPEMRLNLLRGLMDTDGGVDDSNNAIYATSSPALRDGVVELVRSLGGIAVVRDRPKPRYTYRGEVREGHDAYRVYITMPPSLNPFHVSYKADKYKPRTKYLPRRQIVSVVDAGEDVPMQCIQVDAPDHLYVTDGYVLTHNTMAAKLFASWLGVPLVIINMGTIKEGVVGASEHNMAASLDTVWALGDCVVLFDEWDKQSGGIVGGASDGNTSLGMLSLVLDFASDPRRKAFLIFTMNRLHGPIESLRAGRISRFFYTPLPDAVDREEILTLKLVEQEASVPKDLGKVAADKMTEGLSGAELNEMVNEAVALAVVRCGAKTPSLEDFEMARRVVTPVTKLNKEEVLAMADFKDVAVSVNREKTQAKSVAQMTGPARRHIRFEPGQN